MLTPELLQVYRDMVRLQISLLEAHSAVLDSYIDMLRSKPVGYKLHLVSSDSKTV
jgi:hypothetical protein